MQNCYYFRFSQIGVVSYGIKCPSVGVYARISEVKYWIQYIAKGAVDIDCNDEIPFQPGILYLLFHHLQYKINIIFSTVDNWWLHW